MVLEGGWVGGWVVEDCLDTLVTHPNTPNKTPPNVRTRQLTQKALVAVRHVEDLEPSLARGRGDVVLS